MENHQNRIALQRATTFNRWKEKNWKENPKRKEKNAKFRHTISQSLANNSVNLIYFRLHFFYRHTHRVCVKKKWRSLLKYGCDNFARAFTLTSTGHCRACERAYAATHGPTWSWQRFAWTDKNVSFAMAFGMRRHLEFNTLSVGKCVHFQLRKYFLIKKTLIDGRFLIAVDTSTAKLRLLIEACFLKMQTSSYPHVVECIRASKRSVKPVSKEKSLYCKNVVKIKRYAYCRWCKRFNLLQTIQ